VAENVAVWQQQLDDTIIRAPFAGIVTSKNAQPGEMISPMSAGGFTRTGICTVVDMESLEIEIDVNESYINRVEPASRSRRRSTPIPTGRFPARSSRSSRPPTAEVHGQGARRVRQARSAHPAGDEREGGVPRHAGGRGRPVRT
jgi:hypothetical protein